MRVTNVDEKDNGAWTCTLLLQNGDSVDNVDGEIDVTVAVAPSELALRKDDQETIGDVLTFRISESEEASDIACVAAATRPEPTFQWFIGNQPINVRNKDHHMSKSKNFSHLMFYFLG